MRNVSRLIDFQPKFFSCLKNYDKQKFSQDALAGVITGIVALPLAIAFGIASGVSPQEGRQDSSFLCLEAVRCRLEVQPAPLSLLSTALSPIRSLAS